MHPWRISLAVQTCALHLLALLHLGHKVPHLQVLLKDTDCDGSPEIPHSAWLTVHPAIRLGTKPNTSGANSLITPRLDVGIRLRIGELELYIFNATYFTLGCFRIGSWNLTHNSTWYSHTTEQHAPNTDLWSSVLAGIDAATRELHSKVTADRDAVGRLPSLLHPLIRGLRGAEGAGLAATEGGRGRGCRRMVGG
jgi:hypothetical protein